MAQLAHRHSDSKSWQNFINNLLDFTSFETTKISSTRNHIGIDGPAVTLSVKRIVLAQRSRIEELECEVAYLLKENERLSIPALPNPRSRLGAVHLVDSVANEVAE